MADEVIVFLDAAKTLGVTSNGRVLGWNKRDGFYAKRVEVINGVAYAREGYRKRRRALLKALFEQTVHYVPCDWMVVPRDGNPRNIRLTNVAFVSEWGQRIECAMYGKNQFKG